MSRLKSALILVGVIGGTIAFAVVFLGYMAPETGDTTLGGHGTTALILGVSFSLLLGIGLMALMFFSSRRGYDDRDRWQD